MSTAILSHWKSRNWQVEGLGLRLKALGENSANFLGKVNPWQIANEEKRVLSTSQMFVLSSFLDEFFQVLTVS